MHPHCPVHLHTPRRPFQTLGCFMSGIFAKRLDQAGFDVINILMGFEGAEEKAQVDAGFWSPLDCRLNIKSLRTPRILQHPPPLSPTPSDRRSSCPCAAFWPSIAQVSTHIFGARPLYAQPSLAAPHAHLRPLHIYKACSRR